MIRFWSIFTKPWKTLSPDQLGKLVSSMGFEAIEFPLRPGFQVEPEDAEKGLPALSETLKKYGVRISSVASNTEERTFAACQAIGAPILRIMVEADPAIGYMKSIDRKKKELERLIPLCEKYGVTVGVQQHNGFGVFNTMEMRYLLEGFDPKHIGAIWDAAHSALAAEIPAQALDIIWDKLVMVNLKMAFYRRINGPEAPQARFDAHFTTGTNGWASWKDAADILIARGYDGGICMPAEYTDEDRTVDYIARDFAYAKSLFR